MKKEPKQTLPITRRSFISKTGVLLPELPFSQVKRNSGTCGDIKAPSDKLKYFGVGV